LPPFRTIARPGGGIKIGIIFHQPAYFEIAGNPVGQKTDAISQTVNNVAARERKHLTFSHANEEYGIGILKKKIIGMVTVTMVPHGPIKTETSKPV